MAIFYLADTHFGHRAAIDFDDRPFADVEEMNQTMIEHWNEVVGRKDTVYILGDFFLGLKAGEAKQIALALNGHKHLVLGNHDKRNAPWYRDVFGLVTPYMEVHDQVDGFRRNVVLSHYFIPFYPQARYMGFMLHGHTHKTTESEYEEAIKQEIRDKGLRCEAYNVGCMWQDYRPQTLEQIIARQPRTVKTV